jgi:hypothetical protein
MPRSLKILCAACLALVTVCAWPASSPYAMKITVSKPKGSAGEKLATGQPVSTAFTPCQDSTATDALSFQLSYSGGKTVDDIQDVYVFFFDPSADGVTAPRFYMVSRPALAAGAAIFTPRFTVNDIDPVADAYLPAESDLGGTVTESLVGSYLVVDGIPLGTWQLVGIVADRKSVDFGDASTWSAWDVATVVLGQPWAGANHQTCK